MFGKKLIFTSTLGMAALALPAFSQSENPDKNEVSDREIASS
jgi:hypothetical protein